MQFEFTPEQIQLRKTVRDFAESEIAPHVLEWDEEQIFPLEVVKHLGRLGFLGAIFPEDLGGAGLGLSIVRSICVAHGAEIEVDSVVGSGSCFRLKFPLPARIVGFPAAPLPERTAPIRDPSPIRPT